MTPAEKIALITGAGSGIGRALAHCASAAGYRVILIGRNAATLAETAQICGADRTQIVIADVTTAKGRTRLCESVTGGFDLLINNAGTLTVGRIADLTDEEAKAMIDTNLLAPILLCRDLAPYLALRRGRIANIGSMFGDIAFPYFTTYSATKFGLRGLSDALRREYARNGIGVTYVAPRATRTAAAAEFDAFVEPFAMKIDAPDQVAKRAWRGIIAGRRSVYPGTAERILTLIQTIAPRLIDRALIRQAFAPKAQMALQFRRNESEIKS